MAIKTALFDAFGLSRLNRRNEIAELKSELAQLKTELRSVQNASMPPPSGSDAVEEVRLAREILIEVTKTQTAFSDHAVTVRNWQASTSSEMRDLGARLLSLEKLLASSILDIRTFSDRVQLAAENRHKDISLNITGVHEMLSATTLEMRAYLSAAQADNHKYHADLSSKTLGSHNTLVTLINDLIARTEKIAGQRGMGEEARRLSEDIRKMSDAVSFHLQQIDLRFPRLAEQLGTRINKLLDQTTKTLAAVSRFESGSKNGPQQVLGSIPEPPRSG